MSLFIPTYFSPIGQYAAIYQSDSTVFETQDNFQKQTYRNRCYVYGANGKLSLNIPVKHLKSTSGRKKTKDILVENDFPWQSQHFKSIKSAYQTSPYFEFFEDDIAKIFAKKYVYLLDLNIDTYLFVTDALQISQEYSKTKEYEVSPSINDYREFSIAKNGVIVEVNEYTQMFDHKHGFISNLSILDLLFMEGPNALTFLERIKI
ncbi:WbqC family protein [uncultured Tenacibaculum sp.]|uniref:WbqC family protein n=1 Tax=uncultured Tenacibaculum sp. TaxID=174713 RepID=UPI00260188B0|nr:WbqC family protein [uncultured Tenacibaculum sp.]